MEQEKKLIYKKWWFWLIIVIIIIGMCGTGENETTETSTNTADKAENNITIQNKYETEINVIETPTLTMGQKNALATAKSYLNYSAFSYSGLIKQLEFEGYSTEEATYGVDNCGADWNEQAAKMAKSYIDYSSFSENGLINQLEYEGFTKSQAKYGATSVGY